MIRYFFPFLVFFSFSLLAQDIRDNPKHTIDTVHVKGDRFIFIGDNAYYVRRDSTLFLSDTVEFYIRKNNLEKTDAFYKQLEGRLTKSKVSTLIYEQLFKSHEEGKPHGEESSSQRFIAYENEKIKFIKYKYLNVFGSDINDTTVNKSKTTTDILNKSHIHTREWVVRKNLVFKNEERLNPDAMVNSERLLRRQDFIKDARIYVDEQVKNREAGLIVTTKDVFPYNFLLNPNNNNGARFGVSNINIAGIGHELEYNNIKDGGSEFFYRVRNIEGTFIDGELNYADHFRKTGFGLFLTRAFVTQETKYAGGFSVSGYEFGEFDFNPTTDVTSTFAYNLNHTDFWVGRAFRTSLVSNILGLEENTKAVVAIKVDKSDFFDRPFTDAATNFRYHDRSTLLMSIGLTSRNYYKDKFIVQYGRTEDIPTGSALGIVFGKQNGEFKDRGYFGINYARGGYIKNVGYLNAILSIGSFFDNGLENGVFKIGADYYTRLFSLNQFRFRQFADFNLTKAIDPDEEYILSSQDHIGIRGVSNYYHRSTTRLNVRTTSLLFTPAYVFGFRLAVFGFFDFTATSNSRNDFFGTDGFMGFGGGISLKNDNLAISTIRIRLGVYPNAPINASSNLFNIATSTDFNIRDFDFKAPEIVSFN
ncbi:MAG: hypothetical protein ABJP45_10940 [Cyclobacteriaceae bacterium]